MILLSKWLVGVFVLSLSLSWVLTALLAFYYVRADFRALQLESVHEAMRGEVEAVYRTVGKGINPAFRCKPRIDEDKTN